MEKVNLEAAFAGVPDPWRPRVVGELNGQEVKLARIHGTFVWHRHDEAEELFLAVRGRMRVELRDRSVELGPGEFFIVPRGTEHRTASEDGAEALIVTAAGLRNTGNVVDPVYTAPDSGHPEGAAQD